MGTRREQSAQGGAALSTHGRPPSRADGKISHRPRSDAGFSIVELLMASFIVSLVAAGALRLMGESTKNMKKADLVLGRGVISRTLRSLSDNPQDLYRSFATHPNPAISNCVKSPSSCALSGTFPLGLRAPVEGGADLSGTAATPVYYGVDGLPCRTGCASVDKYPIRAVTRVRAVPGGFSLLHCVSLRETPATGSLFRFAARKIPPASGGEFPGCAGLSGLPADSVLGPSRDEYDSTKIIQWSSLAPCPTGQVFLGFGPMRVPLCGRTPPLGSPCGSNEVLKGYTTAGLPLCVPRVDPYAAMVEDCTKGGTRPGWVLKGVTAAGAICRPVFQSGGYCDVPGEVLTGHTVLGTPRCKPLVGSRIQTMSNFGRNSWGKDFPTTQQHEVICPTGQKALGCEAETVGCPIKACGLQGFWLARKGEITGCLAGLKAQRSSEKPQVILTAICGN